VCSLDVDDACPVWNERVRTARKQHACDCCGQVISSGEQYLYHSHVFDGTAGSEKMCAVCWFVRESFANAHGQTCVPSNVLETLRECSHGDRSSPWRLHLAVLLRRRRTAPACRWWLRREWMRRAVMWQLEFTRRVLRMSTTQSQAGGSNGH
jgi:hypothetical protein